MNAVGCIKVFGYVVRFDDPNNCHINKDLVTNVLAVSERSYDTTLIKCKKMHFVTTNLKLYICAISAFRTYFKSKKSEDTKRKSGRSSAIAASCRKRQQRHNVSVFYSFWLMFNCNISES